MFSTTQLQLIQPLAESMYNAGYKYYVAHTNTNLSYTTSYNFVDLTIYFSKEEITSNNMYQFSCETDVKKYDVITRAVSSNDNDSRLPRITVTDYTGIDVTIPSTEFIMSNVIPGHMDCVSLYEYNHQNSLVYNLDLNVFYSIPVLISILIISNWFRVWFGRTGKEN